MFQCIPRKDSNSIQVGMVFHEKLRRTATRELEVPDYLIGQNLMDYELVRFNYIKVIHEHYAYNNDIRLHKLYTKKGHKLIFEFLRSSVGTAIFIVTHIDYKYLNVVNGFLSVSQDMFYSITREINHTTPIVTIQEADRLLDIAAVKLKEWEAEANQIAQERTQETEWQPILDRTTERVSYVRDTRGHLWTINQNPLVS